MMLKRILIAAALLIAACQNAAPMRSPIVSATPIPLKATATPSPWLQIDMNGLMLGMWRPNGWESDDQDQTKGLMMAEPNGGMLVLCSVPPFDPASNNANAALALLEQIVETSGDKGWDATMTRPMAFVWDDLNAAYYLFTTGDGVRALVVAVVLPGQQQVVVCTISAPTQEAARIRTQVAQLLNGMSINSTILHGMGLNVLPDPLPFPRYLPPSGTPQATPPARAVVTPASTALP